VPAHTVNPPPQSNLRRAWSRVATIALLASLILSAAGVALLLTGSGFGWFVLVLPLAFTGWSIRRSPAGHATREDAR
jgi:hypothetical protein